MKYSECICDFSFMIIIYLFLAFPKYMDPFSHTILGRLLAILLIAIYASYDILYGLLFCLLVIIYYNYIDIQCKISREGFLYDYQLKSGKTDDYYKMPHDTSQYVPYNEIKNEYEPDSNEAKFEEKNCPNGILTKNDSRIGDFHVPAEMAGHIYPELAYPGPPCNPCSNQCAFKIIESRLKAEDEITLPKNSNEWFDTILSRLDGGST